MLYGCLFCGMSPCNIGVLLTHIAFYVKEWAEYYHTTYPCNSPRYLQKSDNIHHLGIVRCWVGSRQKYCRATALRDMSLAHSKDPVEHAVLWSFAVHVAVEIQDHEADQWRRRDASIPVSWWDQAVMDVMAGTTTTTAVIRQSRISTCVPTIGKVLVPFNERNLTNTADDLEFGKWDTQRHALVPKPTQPVQHGDFRIRGDSNEIVNPTTGTPNNMVTNKPSTSAVPSGPHRTEVVPATLDQNLRPKCPVPSPAPLPAQSIIINNESDTFNLRSRPTRTRKRGDRSCSTITGYDENEGNEAYRPPQTRTRRVQADNSVVNTASDNDSNSDSDIPVSKKRTMYRTAPPVALTLHVDVFGKLVSVPVTLYTTLNNVISAALAGLSKRNIHAPAIHGSEPLVRFDGSSFMLIDQWCVEWDEEIWQCIKDKVPCLPHPVVWKCELVEVRKEKDASAGKA